jgi:hypothetical protein
VITEKNEIGPGKIEIPKQVDGTTSYFLNIDRVKDGDRFITSTRGTKVIVDYPRNDKFTATQEEWLKNFVNELENGLEKPDSEAWRTLFEQRIDLASAVDVFILQELGRNVDAYWLSSPLYIPANGKLNFGPVWDFNLAFGNANYGKGDQIDGWRADSDPSVWFKSLIKHPRFCEQLKVRWKSLRNGAFSNNTIYRIIDRHRSLIDPYVEENFAIWGGLGIYVWPNAYWLPTFDKEQSALKSWTGLRAKWMDEAIAAMSCG